MSNLTFWTTPHHYKRKWIFAGFGRQFPRQSRGNAQEDFGAYFFSPEVQFVIRLTLL